MIHLVTLLVCILLVEILFWSNFRRLLGSILIVTRKVIHILPQGNISDHWKERVIPAYALRIMKYSIQMFLILLLIFSLLFIVDYFITDFLNFTLSLAGIVESVVFAIGYVYLRKSLIK